MKKKSPLPTLPDTPAGDSPEEGGAAARPRLTVAADCLLTNAPPSLTALLKKQLTIKNPQYSAAKKYGRWVGKKLKPYLYFYEDEDDGLRFPRGFANQAVLLCREETGLDPRISDQRLLLPDADFSFCGDLRPYQQQAVDRLVSRSFGVLEAGTGSGKTVMALAVIARRRQPALVIVHTRELLYQWQERVRQFMGMEAGLVGDGQWRPAPLTVGIVQSVRRRLDELGGLFGHVIVDECHRVPATVFTETVRAFPAHFLLGLSATAYRREEELTRLIHFYMGDTVSRLDSRELAADGAILLPRFYQRTTDFDYAFDGDYQALILALVEDEKRNQGIVADIVRVHGDGQREGTMLVVSDRIEHCRLLQEMLEAAGIRAPLLSGKTPAAERTKIAAAVQAGEVKTLLSTIQLIGEGFDCPGLDTLFLTTPIRFAGRLRQVVGRILRPGKDKSPEVYDYLDARVGVLRRAGRERQRMYLDFFAADGRQENREPVQERWEP